MDKTFFVRWPARRGAGRALCPQAGVGAGGSRGEAPMPDVSGLRAPPGALGPGLCGRGEAPYPHRTRHWSRQGKPATLELGESSCNWLLLPSG
jgi:hypothetical protein